MQDVIRLEDLVPKETELFLSKTGHTYRLRPANLEDEIFIKNVMKSDFKQALENPELTCWLGYRLLTEESKSELQKRKVVFINDNGERIESELGGVKLFACLIQGAFEKMNLQKAILGAFGVDVDKLTKDMEDESKKKNLAILDQSQPLTGPGSSTH